MIRRVSLQLQRDVSAADWIVAGVRDFEFDVGSLVPVCFEAYGRIFHPAYRDVTTAQEAGQDEPQVVGTTPDGERQISFQREVRWSEVAAANGRIAHPAMDWISITGSWQFLRGDSQPPVWEKEPSKGSLPLRQIRRLTRSLASYTMTPDTCWFALWNGYGDLERPRPEPPLVQMPHRPMYLFMGAVDAWTTCRQLDVWTGAPASGGPTIVPGAWPRTSI